jgi:multiple sugar transport system ATP-binding protein
MIYVTHDQVEAMTLADRIVVLNAGRIEQVGTPLELYHRPANLFVAGFLGSPQMNFITCVVSHIGPEGVQVQAPNAGAITVPVSPENVRVGETVTLGIRPDHVKVSSRGSLSGRIDLVEELGENHLLYVNFGKERHLTIREPGDAHHEAGQEVSLSIAGESCHLFRESGEALPLLTPAGTLPARSEAGSISAA